MQVRGACGRLADGGPDGCLKTALSPSRNRAVVGAAHQWPLPVIGATSRRQTRLPNLAPHPSIGLCHVADRALSARTAETATGLIVVARQVRSAQHGAAFRYQVLPRAAPWVSHLLRVDKQPSKATRLNDLSSSAMACRACRNRTGAALRWLRWQRRPSRPQQPY